MDDASAALPERVVGGSVGQALVDSTAVIPRHLWKNTTPVQEEHHTRAVGVQCSPCRQAAIITELSSMPTELKAASTNRLQREHSGC